jgi:hypothetical protein
LKWAGDAQRREQFKTLEDTARQETVQRLSETLGDLVSFVFAAIDTGSGDCAGSAENGILPCRF